MTDPIIEKEESAARQLFMEVVVEPWKLAKPRLKDFSDIYSSQEINRDEQRLAETRRSHDVTKSGLQSEYVAMELLLKTRALPDDAEIIPTSDYDDVFNHTDFVLRLGEGVYVGVDVTSERGERLVKKINRLKGELRSGELGKLKYALDPSSDVKGRLELPHVILELRGEDMDRIWKLIINTKDKAAKEFVQTYANQIVGQLILQLREYHEFIRLLHPNSPDMERRYSLLERCYAEALKAFGATDRSSE